MQRLNNLSSCSLIVLLSWSLSAQAVLTVEYNALVSEWSSSTVADPANGIYPIGGTGQVNQNFFVISEQTDFNDPSTMQYQIGVRISERFSGVPIPTNPPPPGTPPFSYPAPVDPIYYAPPGENPPASGEARWNFDIHLDLRPSGLTLADFDPNDSFITVPLLGTITLNDLFTLNPAFSNGRLIQLSINPNSNAFPAFDPFEITTYPFAGTLVPNDLVTYNQISASGTVVVPEPDSLALIGLVAAGGAIVAVRRNRRLRVAP